MKFIFHAKSGLDLEKFAEKVFDTLDMDGVKQGESSYYPDGVYFQVDMGDISVKVAGESADDWDDYQYWIVLNIASESSNQAGTISNAFISRLASSGLPLAQEIHQDDDGLLQREIYSIDPEKGLEKARVLERRAP